MSESRNTDDSPVTNLNKDNHDDYSKKLYGVIAAHELSKVREQIGMGDLVDISTINEQMQDKDVRIRARVKTTRFKSKRGFIVLRHGITTIQAIIVSKEGVISKEMVKFCGSIKNESIVEIGGTIVKSAFTIPSCTISDMEIIIKKIFVTGGSIDRLPLDFEDACRSEDNTPWDGASHAALDTKLDNRIIHLRTPLNQRLFRVKSEISNFFRSYLYDRNFIEINTPRLISSPSEGGGTVFKVEYFKRHAYLAQSPQLYKQMMICSDFDRVFEIGPVFRAENSQTHRHMTEFTGLDFEMVIKDDYTEVLGFIEELFVSLFDHLKNNFSDELKFIYNYFNVPEFTYLKKTLRLKYSEGIKLLQEDGATDLGPFDDLSTANERRLGQIIKDKYGTDFYTLNKFPLNLRPFYTMQDPNDPELSNSYDIYMRGEEILSGAQRVHDAQVLTNRLIELKIEPSTLQNYINAFKYGAPPHAGCGIGLDRIVMLFFGIGNIRYVSLFPRDPKRLDP